MENSSSKIAGEDKELEAAQHMVDEIRRNPEKGVRFMTLQDILYFERRDGKAEGKDLILEEQIRKKLAKGISEDSIPDLLEQSPETIERILVKIRKEDAVLL